MKIDDLTFSQREELRLTVLEDVLGHQPSWDEIAAVHEIVGDEYIKELFAGVNFVEEDFWG